MMNFNKDKIAIKSLENSLKNNKLSHAYLIVGEDSLYCDEFILHFVKAIFCLNNTEKTFVACEECRNCRSINHDNYVDFYKIFVEKSVKKEDVQQLKADLSIKSFYGKKVYWIKDVEKMTPQAANALLKFLEEPEDDIIAILSCRNISAVLPTIISRCQQIKLSSTSKVEECDEEIEKIIENYLERASKKIHLANIYLFNELKDKETVVRFFTQLSKDVEGAYKECAPTEFSNISKIQEKVLVALYDLNMSVAGTLVLEKFLFSIILEKNSLDFLRGGKHGR